MSTPRFVLLVLLMSLVYLPLTTTAEVVKIGVLSDQNFRATMKQWSGTSSYLKQQLPQHIFQILPYSQQSDLVTDLEKNKLDLLLVNKTSLAQLMTDFALNPMLNVEKNAGSWILARSDNLSNTVTYSITEALLKSPRRYQAKTVAPHWTLFNNADIKLSIQQQIKQGFNQFLTSTKTLVSQHWTLLIATLLSATLILLYRQWDRYHTRITEIKKHQQQRNDPSLSDTVY